MALSREQFLAKRISGNFDEFTLPDGDTVLLREVSAKLYRDYKSSLRDKDGMPIPERQAYGDELLLARVLVDETGRPMITEAEVLSGILDDMLMAPVRSAIARVYENLGIGDDEERSKKSSATDSTEQ